jgi:predicted permease
VLATSGGALGTLLATWGTELFVSALPAALDLPRTGEIGVDVRTLAFAILVTILTAVLFGLVPSMSAARSAPQPALREATRGASSGLGQNRVGSILIVSQVALAFLLLAGAGLLGRSFWELSRVDPGFQAEQVVTMRTTLAASRYETDDRIRLFSRELLARIGRLTEVHAVGIADYLPMTRAGTGGAFDIEGRPVPRVGDQPGSWISIVGGDYFEAMGIPLLRGRFFGDADTERTQPVFIIDDELARRHWPGEDPIGARLVWRRSERETLSGEVVGVVGGVRWGSLAADPPGTTYWWFPQVPDRQLTIMARTMGDPIALAGAIAAQVREVDPNQPVAEIRAMQDFISADLAQPRFTMLLLGSFAAAAVLLSAIGLYGVIAFGVAQRTREIGLHVALGAQHGDVLRLVMRRGMLLTGLGLVIGIASALAFGRVVASLLYGVSPADPATLLAVTLLLAAVATLATYVPARRATRVDPMVALRAE